MKKIRLFMLASIGATALMFSACTDDCKDITCENGGTCEEGVCDCPDNYYGDLCQDNCVNGTYSSGNCSCETGYEGDNCTTESSDKFVGTYSVTDDCVSNAYSSEISVSSNDGHTNILIADFGSYVCNGEAPTVEASVDGTDLTIEQQTFCAGNEFTIQGSGSMNASGTVLTINYNGTGPQGETYNCTATMTLQ